MPWDNKTLQLFNELKSKQSFQNEVLAIRRRFGLREHPNGETLSSAEIIESGAGFGADVLLAKFDLPNTWWNMLRIYILEDDFGIEDEIKHSDNLPIPSIHKVNMLLHFPDKLVMEIYPGAVKSDAIKFLRDWWPMLEQMLSESFPDEYGKRIKFKSKHNRDILLGKMYEDRIIKADGSWREPEFSNYIQTKLPGFQGTKYEAFKLLDLDIPRSSEGRRKIIRAYNKSKK